MNGGGISVAMATYNGARFLQAQLDSLAAQELLPTELVVCDDGSTDATVEILRSFAAVAPFVVRIVVNRANLGWRANFMQAAGHCTAGLIAFCDQDDLWYRHKLRIMAGLMADPSVLLAHHDADLIDADSKVHGRLRAHDRDIPCRPPLARPVHWESPLGLTLVFRRSLLAFSTGWAVSADPTKPAMPAAHDQWFFALASCFGAVAFASQPLRGYRQHGGNAVGFDHVRRSGSASDPVRVAARLAGETAMVDAFCRVLERVGRDARHPFGAQIPAVLARCRRLRDHLALRVALRHRPALAGRAAALAGLLRDGSYGRSDAWQFGYRDLLADLRAALSTTAAIGVSLSGEAGTGG